MFQKLGLSIGETVCLNCQYRKTCGYRKGIQSARGSKHQICTHDRFRVLPRTAIKQKNVIIEEDATNLLAPVVHATEGFDVVALAAKKACERKPDDKTELLEALEHIQNVAEMFDKAIDTAQRNHELELPDPITKLQGVVTALYDRGLRNPRTRRLIPGIDGNALKTVLGIGFGQAKRAMLFIDRPIIDDRVMEIPAIETVHQIDFPPCQRLWISDGSADLKFLSSVLPGIVDTTPNTHVMPKHSIYQIPDSIYRNTSKSRATRILQNALRTYCTGRRVGLITHQPHLSRHLQLTVEERSQVVRESYFGASDTRGSNSWYKEVDILLVAGTPIPNPVSIRQRVQAFGDQADLVTDEGEVAVAGKWGEYSWLGTTVDGKEVRIKSKGYQNHGCKRAFHSLVHQALFQCYSRARLHMDDGIPCIVICAEPLGLPLVRPTLSKTADDVYQAVLAGCTTVAEIATKLNIPKRSVQRHVKDLCSWEYLNREARIKICPNTSRTCPEIF